jgi:predicted nuclease with RNAse H fold
MRKVFIGIDAGSLRTQSWIAYLVGRRFRVDDYEFTPENLDLHWLPDDVTGGIAIDAPQGLPGHGPRRRADRDANTPTRILPATRRELRTGRQQRDGVKYPFLSVVQLGCDLFWRNRCYLYGLNGQLGKLVETYPRAILLKRPLDSKKQKIPSKKRNPLQYAKFVEHLLTEWGYSWGHGPQVVDQYDAMLCALAAKAHAEGRADYLGEPAAEDSKEKVIREGYIVLPQAEWLLPSNR